MVPLPYDRPVAAGVFWVMFIVFALGDLAVLLRGRVRNREEPADLDGASRAVAIGAVAVAIVSAFSAAAILRAAAIAPNTPSVRWLLFSVGVALLCAGITLRQWAISTLGRYFTLELRVDVGQPVIDSGPYRLVRHPSYTGALLSMLGVGLALGNWVSLAVAVFLPLVGFLRRIAVEEQTLSNSLGEPYQRYAATRRRLVPGLW